MIWHDTGTQSLTVASMLLCSTFVPTLPLLNTLNWMDLSNHLVVTQNIRSKVKMWYKHIKILLYSYNNSFKFHQHFSVTRILYCIYTVFVIGSIIFYLLYPLPVIVKEPFSSMLWNINIINVWNHFMYRDHLPVYQKAIETQGVPEQNHVQYYNVTLYQTLGATSSRETKKMADSTASRLGRLLVVSSLCLTYKQNKHCAHNVLQYIPLMWASYRRKG